MPRSVRGCYCLRRYAVVAALIIAATTTTSESAVSGDCPPSSCGNIRNITYPFRLKGHPSSCRSERGLVELECDETNNRTTLHIGRHKFYVRGISYDHFTTTYTSTAENSYVSLWVVDPSVSDSNDTCFVPRLSRYSSWFQFTCGDWWPLSTQFGLALLNCSEPVAMSTGYSLVATSPCYSNYTTDHYFYVFKPSRGSLLDDSCVIQATIPYSYPRYRTPAFPIKPLTLSHNISLLDINQRLLNGFQVNVKISDGQYCYSFFQDLKWRLGVAWYYSKFYILHRPLILIWTITGVLLLRTSLGIVGLIAIIVYKWRRRHLSVDDTIEEFLRNQNTLIHYSYSEIKTMTQDFKLKLGQGGFGTVYKGKLRSGNYVAVKVLLNKASKNDGKDFINEVGTIGRIHHVNVVRLVGLCVDESNLCLVYDFMPNGSLDKLLFSGTDNHPIIISWSKMHEIVLGVARGIEYLHQGCEMQILHFDIKPHNILLDENFVPKVSDFGLAKLYAVDDNMVSVTAIRGTPGYMAPELFYKNIGGVSSKADVYSFGMLLMDMMGKRKNADAFVMEQLSDVDFPTLMYDHIERHEKFMELGDASEDEKTMVKKMIVVAFWCIQMNPAGRPSMRRVLEMLEGESEFLEMPPRPSMHRVRGGTEVRPASSFNHVDTITLDGR